MSNKKIPKKPHKSIPTTRTSKRNRTRATRGADNEGNHGGSESSTAINRCDLRVYGPLAIFTFDCHKTQYDAFSRLAAFYESSNSVGRYVSLEQAQHKRLCPNYEAFNVPTAVVRDWLGAMRAAAAEKGKLMLNSDKTTQNMAGDQPTRKRKIEPNEEWWVTLTNQAESSLLARLSRLGCLNSTKPKTSDQAIASSKATVPPTYIIAVASADALPHEALHALYFLHADYRECAQKVWDGLSSRCQANIQHDLKQRGYAPHIWADEFQAYVSEDEAIFGNRARQECSQARRLLLSAQYGAWLDLRLDLNHLLKGERGSVKEKVW